MSNSDIRYELKGIPSTCQATSIAPSGARVYVWGKGPGGVLVIKHMEDCVSVHVAHRGPEVLLPWCHSEFRPHPFHLSRRTRGRSYSEREDSITSNLVNMASPSLCGALTGVDTEVPRVQGGIS
ncbi:hypothetical protein DPEC_G00140030 [Dallia pectoralis]|uniref:Uncharacterized protein n=1 Tax=Dallia pectoralis TaxID=75939 RepID=A0ACC2GMD8_DALPE|nr:hypothetical protein DPEC_G00140030 [Dallia pectoralis]